MKKKSSEQSYNQRLYNQYLRQKNYTSTIFRCANVYQYSEDADGRTYFTMDYINGKTVAEEMRTIELYRVPLLGDKFAALLPDAVVPNPGADNVFKNKIAILAGKICGKGSRAKQALEELKSFDWSAASGSPCHGDLTLENMILRNGEIYLIDFLDSFYDSWAIDLAKILQDADLHWHYRYEGDLENNLKIRLHCLKDSIVGAILAHDDGERLYSTVYHVLLLNVLRIIPYCRDEITEEWIERQIDHVLKIIKNR